MQKQDFKRLRFRLKMKLIYSPTEKLQNLQKEAVKVQINLDTDTLNKIEALRNCHRKAAMQDFEEWRSNAEMPILQDISGKVQKNRKAYRYRFKKRYENFFKVLLKIFPKYNKNIIEK